MSTVKYKRARAKRQNMANHAVLPVSGIDDRPVSTSHVRTIVNGLGSGQCEPRSNQQYIVQPTAPNVHRMAGWKRNVRGYAAVELSTPTSESNRSRKKRQWAAKHAIYRAIKADKTLSPNAAKVNGLQAHLNAKSRKQQELELGQFWRNHQFETVDKIVQVTQQYVKDNADKV